MSDNEDLLADDLGDHSLADYNLGNEEEEQLLADDYENASQNVPASIASYVEPEILPAEYPVHEIPYNPPPVQYQMPPEPECVVPNITVEVPNTPIPEHSTYAPYEPRYEVEHAVPPAIPAAPMESPQIVPSDMPVALPNESRERFPSERPAGARAPVARDIPDSLDKVVVPGGGFPGGGFPGRGRTWRHPQYRPRMHHYNQYRRNNMHRGNFQPRPQFPPPQPRQPLPPSPRMGPPRDLPPQMSPDDRPLPPERPMLPPEPYDIRPPFNPNQPRFFRPNMDRPNMERPNFMRPPFEPRPMFFRPPFNPRPQFNPLREVVPNSNHIPQVTIRHGPPGPNLGPKQQEVRMLPVQLPASLPPGGLAGKKVLINPHFKGNFQPVDGLPLPAYIPTRIQKSPPLSPTLENKFGPIKDIDDAAERFIAEQRSALARAAGRKPQRYIENTTIEIENELAQSALPAPAPPPRNSSDDDELLRRQEEFINANRAGLRRRMRSPSPPPVRRSPSPRRSPDRRLRADTRPANDEDSEYRRRMREQESLRERVLRAKEARRRKNAVASQKQMQDRERERLDKEKVKEKEKEKDRPAPADTKLPPARTEPATNTEVVKPDTTRKTPEKESEKETVREKTPVKEENTVNSTCENLTPPRAELPAESPERALTPPLPAVKTEPKLDSDDDLDLILGDIDGILSDDEDTGRFKDKSSKSEPPKPKSQVDLRTKLPPKTAERESKKEKPPRQKIIFQEEKREREERKKREKTPPPPKRTVVTSSTKTEDSDATEKKLPKTKEKSDVTSAKSRSRITFDNKKEPEKETTKTQKEEPKTAFTNRRVILQRKVTPKEKSVFARIEVKNDPAKPNPGIFSRAVRTAIGVAGDSNRIVIKKQDDPAIEYESDSDIDESKLLEEDVGLMAMVENLPHGMTDTRLKTLAGAEVQSLVLVKEERSAKITFKTTAAAESFKRKFNNKMVAASRLGVTLR